MQRVKVHPNVYSYSAAISASERGGQWALALALLVTMFTVRILPNKFRAKEGNGTVGLGVKFFSDKNIKEQKSVFIDSLSSRGEDMNKCSGWSQWKYSCNHFCFDTLTPDVTSDVTSDVSDVRCNVRFSYSAAISACGKNGQWQRALRLFEEMVTTHVSPNVVSVNATISAFEKVGKTDCVDCAISTWCWGKKLSMLFPFSFFLSVRRCWVWCSWKNSYGFNGFADARLESGSWRCVSWKVFDRSHQTSSATMLQWVHARKAESGRWLCMFFLICTRCMAATPALWYSKPWLRQKCTWDRYMFLLLMILLLMILLFCDAFAHFRKKISPDVTSYGAVVSACEKDAEWQLALHLLRRWQRKTVADDSMIPLNCPKL